MLSNITGKINITMNSSSAFKSVVAVSAAYIGGKLIDHFTSTSIKKEDTKIRMEEIKKEIILKEMDIKNHK
jgi:hypothetical protein